MKEKIDLIPTIIFVILISLTFMASCGSFKKAKAELTGYSEIVIDHVVYLQFPSGVTVKYNQDGTICTR